MDAYIAVLERVSVGNEPVEDQSVEQSGFTGMSITEPMAPQADVKRPASGSSFFRLVTWPTGLAAEHPLPYSRRELLKQLHGELNARYIRESTADGRVGVWSAFGRSWFEPPAKTATSLTAKEFCAEYTVLTAYRIVLPTSGLASFPRPSFANESVPPLPDQRPPLSANALHWTTPPARTSSGSDLAAVDPTRRGIVALTTTPPDPPPYSNDVPECGVPHEHTTTSELTRKYSRPLFDVIGLTVNSARLQLLFIFSCSVFDRRQGRT
ncbi:hypothetical protein K438DRAFT_1782238 [Mycena galopus ATCC 62051]|nr:hypothetical protein K438DRAFT_1782238 [Mycena galopus ATCC 62051]